MPYRQLLSALLVSILASCSSVSTSLGRGSLAPPRAVSVVAKPDASGDARVRAALEAGLVQRGLTGGKSRVTVEFDDTWRWDMAMYLSVLNLRFMDSATGQLFGTASWRQTGLHVFPAPESAAAALFKTMDAAGAFAK